MSDTHYKTNPDGTLGIEFLDWLGAKFRPDLAFPSLSEEMIERLRSYGREEVFPHDVRLYGEGDRNISSSKRAFGGVWESCKRPPAGWC